MKNVLALVCISIGFSVFAHADILTVEALVTSTWCYQGSSLGYREEIRFQDDGFVEVDRFSMGVADKNFGQWAIQNGVLTVFVKNSVIKGSNRVQSFTGSEIQLRSDADGVSRSLSICSKN